MKITKKIKETALGIFKGNSSLTELFVTVDGDFFTKSNPASNAVKGDKKKYARILRSDVLSEGEVEDKKDELETAKVVESGMVLITDDKKELVFTEIKNEVREPLQGDVAEFEGAPANGKFLYQESTLEFKDGKLEKIKFKQDGARSLFGKFFGK